MTAIDWASWRVRADRLTEQGDPRGELLLLAYEATTCPPDERTVFTELVEEAVDQWAEQAEWSERQTDLLEVAQTARQLRHLLSYTARPLPLIPNLAVLLAVEPPGLESWFDGFRFGLITWIEEAFRDVNEPDLHHRTLQEAEAADNYGTNPERRTPGRPWTSIDEGYLLANQWGLAHLDCQGVHYYAPAVMCFALRHLPDFHPEDHWITESLEYTLQPSRKPPLIEHQRRRLSLLTREQRVAIAAFTLVTQNPAARQWVYSLEGPEEAWLDRFQSPISSR